MIGLHPVILHFDSGWVSSPTNSSRKPFEKKYTLLKKKRGKHTFSLPRSLSIIWHTGCPLFLVPPIHYSYKEQLIWKELGESLIFLAKFNTMWPLPSLSVTFEYSYCIQILKGMCGPGLTCKTDYGNEIEIHIWVFLDL